MTTDTAGRVEGPGGGEPPKETELLGDEGIISTPD
jgi:hypothetical protein